MDTASELQKVRENLAAWLNAFNARDIDALMGLYDPESVYANAAAPLMRGVDEVRPWYEQAFGMVSGELLYREETHFISSELAILVGAYYFQPPADVVPPENMTLTGRVALMYRRDAHGNWKLLFDMDNTPPDVTPESFASPSANGFDMQQRVVNG